MKVSHVCFILLFILCACGQLDVVGKDSVVSFGKFADILSNQIEFVDEGTLIGWIFESPDSSAVFYWSSDYSQGGMYDLMLMFEAQPFIDAGLDVDRLPQGMFYDDFFMVGSKLGEDKLRYEGLPTPLDSYKHLVKLYRKVIGYHADLDHHGIEIADGYMFEWARDFETNDKDIVFVLNPEPFISAGADPNNISGWVFGKVKKMDEKGNPYEVDRFLKPFDVR
jgi:hypothetical protein